MKLTYRGVQYQEENRNFSALLAAPENKNLVYRGNSLRARINPKFPWLRYIKQLFSKSESETVFDPIAFWYDHKRKYIQECWHIDDLERLDCAWNLTLQIEQAKAVKSQQIKLKYRGVTYYR